MVERSLPPPFTSFYPLIFPPLSSLPLPCPEHQLAVWGSGRKRILVYFELENPNRRQHFASP